MKEDFLIYNFPSSRLFTLDVGTLSLKRHYIKALIEIDVTDSRNKLKSLKSKQKISFTSWVLKCISQAIIENNHVHAFLKGTNQLIIFKDIDISIIIEKEVNGDYVPIPLIIRNVNKKSIIDLYDEIDSAKKHMIKNENDYVLGNNSENKYIKFFSLLPQSIRLIIWRILLSNPKYVKKIMGTVAVTSVGMMGKVRGWGIPFSIHPLCFSLGSIIKKPGVTMDKIEIREYLQITILLDHDVIDGAPAARFVSTLVNFIENGFML